MKSAYNFLERVSSLMCYLVPDCTPDTYSTSFIDLFEVTTLHQLNVSKEVYLLLRHEMKCLAAQKLTLPCFARPLMFHLFKNLKTS